MTLATPTNCWTYHEQLFADAVANSEAFIAFVGAASATDAKDKIFGERVTHPRSGRTYTVDELANLGSHARVFPSADQPYGKHAASNGVRQLYPHGRMIVEFCRFVSESQLEKRAYDADDRTGLTDQHDRDFRNMHGVAVDEIVEWMDQNGGAGPSLPTFEVIDFGESPANTHAQQGVWQVCAYEFTWVET